VVFFAVVKLDGSVPVKYGMRLNMDSKYSAVKEHLSQLTGLPVCKLVLAEVASAQLKVRLGLFIHTHFLLIGKNYRSVFLMLTKSKPNTPVLCMRMNCLRRLPLLSL